MNKLKEINGKYYQECEVILLPTESGSNTSMDTYGRMYFGNYPENTPFNQHLYITSNEEIKKGDWFINRQYMIEEDKEEYAIWRCGDITPNSNPKKIIATTDTSLTIIDYVDCEYPLPQPSKSFIQAYIKAYNKGKPITKVLIEMHISKINYKGEIKLLHFLNDVRGPIITSLIPKVNSSNEITIKKIKDSYTREKLRPIFLKLCHDTADYIENDEKTEFNIDNWIEENL